MSLGEAPLAAVIGHPVSHSISPEIFAFLSNCAHTAVEYRRLDIPPSELRSALRLFRKSPFFAGWNVTIPHKESVFRQVDRLSPEARLIGAVNVVKFERGKLVGHNTDAQGIRETFREHGVIVKGRSAVIYGAGGAAMAAGYVLGEQRAARVLLANRSSARARKAQAALSRRFRETRYLTAGLHSFDPGSIDLFVNATPLGMKGFPRNTLFPKSPKKVKPGAVAFDVVYRPEVTGFLRDANQRGAQVIGGLDMLIWQALGAYEIWFGEIGTRKKTARLKDALKTHMKTQLRKMNR